MPSLNHFQLMSFTACAFDKPGPERPHGHLASSMSFLSPRPFTILRDEGGPSEEHHGSLDMSHEWQGVSWNLQRTGVVL